MADRRIVIGLGTGRCGTQTLAELIDAQPGGVGSHELRGARVHWEGGAAEVERVLDALQDRLNAGATLVGEVGLYYLPYVDMIRHRFPDVRFIVLKRDREATVDSFLEKTQDKANHWAPTLRFARHARWNACFPTYPVTLPKRAAIGRYWDEYYAQTDAYERAEPGVFHTVRTEQLGEEATQRQMLDFMGVPKPDQVVITGLRRNRAEDVQLSPWRRFKRWLRRRDGSPSD